MHNGWHNLVPAVVALESDKQFCSDQVLDSVVAPAFQY